MVTLLYKNDLQQYRTLATFTPRRGWEMHANALSAALTAHGPAGGDRPTPDVETVLKALEEIVNKF